MSSEQIPHVPISTRLRVVGVSLLALALAVAAIGIFVRTSHAYDLQQDVESQHVTVKTVVPQSATAESNCEIADVTAKQN